MGNTDWTNLRRLFIGIGCDETMQPLYRAKRCKDRRSELEDKYLTDENGRRLIFEDRPLTMQLEGGA